jgi:tetratricopeptide (TPR) repeat protein
VSRPIGLLIAEAGKDIGDAIKPFYGDEAGKKLTSLLTDHIKIAAELVGAAKMKQSEKREAASARWNANANDIAKFLSEANPGHWSADEMRKMMEEHLELTMAEVAARLKGDWKEAIRAYTQALQLKPGDADIHNKLGDAYYYSGRLREAIERWSPRPASTPQGK